jgi:nucleotide-binding universal stress UspA family protein
MSTDGVVRRGLVFHKILLAYDGSAHAETARAMAADLALRYGATLVLLHAFPRVPTLLGSPQYDQLLAERSLLGEQLLGQARSHLPETLVVETQLLEGPPAEAILRVAAEDGCDLIVLGSRGRSQLAELVLGSVSSAVAHRATCPVLIARPVEQRHANG